MADHPFITEAAANSNLVTGSLLTSLLERAPYVLKKTETLGDLDQTSGRIIQVVHSQATGFAYYLDAADSTTPDDGVTCLVDADGRRYKIADSEHIMVSSVLAMQNTPPGSPSVGDFYIAGVSPTGAWAGHAKEIALYSPRGWVFAVPTVGMSVLNQATGLLTQYSAAGKWGGLPVKDVLFMVASGQESNLAAVTAALTLQSPYVATITGVMATLKTASTSGAVTVDINKNGGSIFSTLLTIDQDEKTSETAATPAVISTTSLALGDELTIDIDGAGTGAKGLVVYLYLTRTIE